MEKEGDKAVFGQINTNYPKLLGLNFFVKGCCGVLVTSFKKKGVVEYFIESPQFSFEKAYENSADARKDINNRLSFLEGNSPLRETRSKQVKAVFDQLTLAEVQKERELGKGGLGKLLSSTSGKVIEGKIEKVSHIDLFSTDDSAKIFYATALAQIEESEKK